MNICIEVAVFAITCFVMPCTTTLMAMTTTFITTSLDPAAPPALPVPPRSHGGKIYFEALLVMDEVGEKRNNPAMNHRSGPIGFCAPMIVTL